jgi:SPP1 gp7 family putative phage head morphogenesis protein
MSGREYAATFSNMEKLGWIPDDWSWQDDVREILAHLRVRPSQYILNEIHEALMKGEGPPVEKLSKRLGYEAARDVARTVMLNTYIKSALRKWDEDGIKHVKRLAIEDNKTCPLCRALNGKEYQVSELLLLPNPQSAETHVSCRCTFIPLIDISTYAPKRRKLPDLNLKLNGAEATNVPIEIYSLLKSIMLKSRLPFNIKFNNQLKEDRRLSGGTLTINPKSLSDEDLREIIYEEQAERMWPKVEARVVSDYLPLLQHGFAKASRSWDTPKEVFVNNWVAYKLGQAPMNEDLWSQAFFKDIAK